MMENWKSKIRLRELLCFTITAVADRTLADALQMQMISREEGSYKVNYRFLENEISQSRCALSIIKLMIKSVIPA